MTSAHSRPNQSAQSTAPARWEEAEHEQRRELIVDAALALLQNDGLKAVTMRRVAQRLSIGAMTLYTYVDGQRELHREMVRRGFAMLHRRCKASSTLGTPEGWRGGSQAYIRFAIDHPNLYKLMFDTPMAEDDRDLMQGGFEPLMEKVRAHLAAEGLDGDRLEEKACAATRRYWIALHGLAMLAIAGRLDCDDCDLDTILDDMLPRIAPSG